MDRPDPVVWYIEFEGGEGARVVVVTGAGDRAFCAGAALLTVTASTEDATEGIAAFQEKRPPRWAVE